MFDDAHLLLLGFPLAGLAFGAIAYLWLRRETQGFEQRYGRPQTPGE